MAKEKELSLVEGDQAKIAPVKPSREETEEAVRVLLRWAGDDPERPGLLGTPDRVVRAYEEYFQGYSQDPHELLGRTFDETDGYDEIVVLKDIPFASHCEHHIAPIIGKVRGLSSQLQGCRHLEAGAAGRNLCKALADPGKIDGADRQHP